jgi:hypothetical protein
MNVGSRGIGAPEVMFPRPRKLKRRSRRYKATHLAAFMLGAFLLLILMTWGILYIPRWL